MAELQKSMFDEPTEKSMFDSETVDAAPVEKEEETTEGLTLADQLAQGFAAPPDPYTPERSPQELSDERERAICCSSCKGSFVINASRSAWPGLWNL